MNLCGDISERYWREITADAARRKIAFALTPEEAWTVYVLQNKKCSMTGRNIDFSSYGYRGTASLDRIDSDKPYISGNIQWVFSPINIMKGSHNMKYFVELCCMVASYSQPRQIARTA